jgi:predicted PurR-regulated permease PerM
MDNIITPILTFLSSSPTLWPLGILVLVLVLGYKALPSITSRLTKLENDVSSLDKDLSSVKQSIDSLDNNINSIQNSLSSDISDIKTDLRQILGHLLSHKPKDHE